MTPRKMTHPNPMAALKRPARPTDLDSANAFAQQSAAINALATSVPHDANKSKASWRDNAVPPPAWQTVEPSSA